MSEVKKEDSTKESKEPEEEQREVGEVVQDVFEGDVLMMDVSGSAGSAVKCVALPVEDGSRRLTTVEQKRQAVVQKTNEFLTDCAGRSEDTYFICHWIF